MTRACSPRQSMWKSHLSVYFNLGFSDGIGMEEEEEDGGEDEKGY